MDIFKLSNLIGRYGITPATRENAELAAFAELAEHEDVRAYLKHCVAAEDFTASGMNVCGFRGLVEENLEQASPGLFLRDYGYLVIATSIGGNAVCLDTRRGRVFWAYHDSFFDNLISYKHRASGRWIDLQDYTAENVERALIPLDDDIGHFLEEMFAEKLTGKLDELD